MDNSNAPGIKHLWRVIFDLEAPKIASEAKKVFTVVSEQHGAVGF